MFISSLLALKETFRQLRGHNQRKLHSCSATVLLCSDDFIGRSSPDLSRKKE